MHWMAWLTKSSVDKLTRVGGFLRTGGDRGGYFWHIHNVIEMAIEINEANFEEVVMNTDKPVMVDFWA